MSDDARRTWPNWLGDRALRGVIGGLRALPYPTRLAVAGSLMARAGGPLAGYRGRALAQLAYVFPEMPEARRRAVATAALDNAGRFLAEIYAPEDQAARMDRWAAGGAGLQAALDHRDAGRPVMFMSAHYGNYQAGARMVQRLGFRLAVLYREMANPYLNAHYVATLEAGGIRAFPRTSRGLGAFVKHLKGGGAGAILIDQYVIGGVPMPFLGKPAPTSPIAGEMGLKYGALIVPSYMVRRPDGVDFDMEIEAPIQADTGLAITQGVLDSLSARIRRQPEQWFWMHRRWKPERQARKAARAAAQT